MGTWGHKMQIKDLYVGQTVYYIPRHAKGDFRHKDTERGIVSRIRDNVVFVRFGNDTHGKACDPALLY